MIDKLKTLILAGAGHGHIQILAKLKQLELADLKILVITNFDRQFYSGMLPGYINGSFSLEEVSFHVEEYCDNPNIELVIDVITKIDKDNRTVYTLHNKYTYDFLSMNLGSASLELFGSPTDTINYVKPIYGFKTLKDLGSEIKKLLIVGGGASGIELALAYNSKYPHLKIELVDQNEDILLHFNIRTRKIARKILKNRGIKLSLNTSIRKLKTDKAYFDKGTIAFDKVLVSTGVKGVDINFAGFSVDKSNFVKVDSKLFAAENVLAMGDMVHLKDFPNTPKAGVFAIRMTPILVNNVFALIFNSGNKDKTEKYQRYIPQNKYLQIINTSDQKAILSFGKFAMYNKLALKIKNRIDRDYMKGKLVTDNFLKL